MNALETYQSDAVERPLIRRRLFWALVASLIIHLCVIVWFRATHLAQFNAPAERLVPRDIFNLKDIKIYDGPLNGGEEQEAQKTADQKPDIKPLNIPDEKPLADVTEGKMTPAAAATPDLVQPLVNEKPMPETNSVQAITRAQESATKVIEEDLTSLRESILKDQPGAVPHAKIRLPDTQGGSGGRSDSAGMAAASERLDRLIGNGLHSGDAPVTLPGGALFEFDSSDVRPAAIEQLRKLGLLIQKNPNVTFSIEGFTDSFGDAAYNEQLSQARADAVRNWLVQNMDANPAHIQTKGYGATNFLVTPKPVDMQSQASIEQEKLLEQPNRRVEILFKFPKTR